MTILQPQSLESKDTEHESSQAHSPTCWSLLTPSYLGKTPWRKQILPSFELQSPYPKAQRLHGRYRGYHIIALGSKLHGASWVDETYLQLEGQSNVYGFGEIPWIWLLDPSGQEQETLKSMQASSKWEHCLWWNTREMYSYLDTTST